MSYTHNPFTLPDNVNEIQELIRQYTDTLKHSSESMAVTYAWHTLRFLCDVLQNDYLIIKRSDLAELLDDETIQKLNKKHLIKNS